MKILKGKKEGVKNMDIDLVDGVLNFNLLDVLNSIHTISSGCVSSSERYIVYLSDCNKLEIFDKQTNGSLSIFKLPFNEKRKIKSKHTLNLDKEISGRWTLLRLCHALLVENYTLLDSTLFFTIDEFIN